MGSYKCSNCGRDLELSHTDAPCPYCGVQGIELRFEDKLEMKGRVVLQKAAHDQAIRDVSDEGRSSSADVSSENAKAISSLSAKPRHGETGNQEVCSILRARLNKDGANWTRCDCVELQDVDCRLVGDKVEPLQLQMTRPADTQKIWHAIEAAGQTNDERLLVNAVEQLKDGIENKAKKLVVAQRKDLVLVLDAIETPIHVTDEIVNSFRQKHGAWAKDLGFIAIWVVGPNEALTHRLDEKSG